MRKILCLLLCAAILAVGMLVPCRAEEIGLSATAAIVMDADTGAVLYEKNADRRMLIASTTKIMTALVALEQAPPDKAITVTAQHMVEGSSMYLAVGETVSVEQLLYGLMLCSGNDAALALADVCCGSVEAFVEEMNRMAARLQMENSSFANPNGLDDENHYSTARDMARLAAFAAGKPLFVRLCSTTQVSTAGRTMTNHNRLLKSLDGCIGMKTGYTMAAGRTLVSCVVRNGRTLVAVTLQDGNDWADHEALYEYGFDKICPKEEAP